MDKDQSSSRPLFNRLKELDTEQRNRGTQNIDVAEPAEIAKMINEEDQKVAGRVENKLDEIGRAITLISEAMRVDGRLIYVGAGTSGRLGVLDAAECPPTFGTDPEQVKGLIAGGKEAMFVSQEGAEDDPENGVQAVRDEKVAPPDVVCGIAASGRTPYVLGALKEARRRTCNTILITTVAADQLASDIEVDQLIDIPVGPEVIMGSTRMKSATAQKMVLNMLSTGAMVRQGKTYENVMVDLQLSNDKLKERARRILMMFTEISYEAADELLHRSDGHVKTALLMGLADVNQYKAQQKLNKHRGFIRPALNELRNDG